MTLTQKELLSIACAYSALYSEDKKVTDVTLLELFEFLQFEMFVNIAGNNYERAKNMFNEVQHKLHRILNGKNITIDVLTLVLQCCLVLVENKAFKLSKAMKLNRLTNIVYEEFQAQKGFTQEWRNTVDVINDLIVFNDKVEKGLIDG